MKRILTVREVLSINKALQLLCGEKGIDNFVSWNIYLDNDAIVSYPFSGQELVFSDFDHYSEDKMISLIQILLKNNVSGLGLKDSSVLTEKVLKLVEANLLPLFYYPSNMHIQQNIKQQNSYITNDEDGCFTISENYYNTLTSLGNGHSSKNYEEYNVNLFVSKKPITYDFTKKYIEYTANFLGIDICYWHILTEPIYSSKNCPKIQALLDMDTLNKLDHISEYDFYQ
ncbi:MAG: PucR family transcriptional regulator ligand-binding domain-containing protein, partial [Erysipelotrichales bacterium]|nr:PucR family transcriptional regulator ligand-binding domain-containing protein [Erysipelotrichales bacterium]